LTRSSRDDLCGLHFRGRIGKSTDGGKTWALMMQGITTGTSAFTYYLVMDPLHPMTLLAGLNGIDFITRDGAQNWSQVFCPQATAKAGRVLARCSTRSTPGKVYLYNTRDSSSAPTER
jgi:photosystem II stability/assembly factor-like uncharacterized protein